MLSSVSGCALLLLQLEGHALVSIITSGAADGNFIPFCASILLGSVGFVPRMVPLTDAGGVIPLAVGFG